MPWPISNHESPDVNLSIPGVTAPHYLWAFLSADQQPFRADNYAIVRANIASAVQKFTMRTSGGQPPSADVSDQRLRTWKTAFEELGLLTVDDNGAVAATRFGRAVLDGLNSLESALVGANAHIAQLGAMVANRVMLAKPDGHGNPPAGVPLDSDLLPIRTIWRAFRRLGNSLHWQDINRVLGHLHYEHEVEGALERIQQFRDHFGNDYPTDEPRLATLGTVGLTDDPRHITPWFNRAGIGGLLIPSEPLSNGFRQLSHAAINTLDSLLSETAPQPPAAARSDRQAYIRYLMAPVEAATLPSLDPQDATLAKQVTDAIADFGDKKIIVLSGIPATGKSRIARMVADRITDGDPGRIKDIQFHESTTYEDFIEGFIPRSDGQGFERRDKTFRVINQRALDDPASRPHVLLIEEFTRANVHSVLGELLTFIEHRGRRFTLPLSQEEIEVAPNLVVIATMNPRDRSAISLDDAVIRRMHRITVPPSVQSLRNMLDGHLPVTELAQLATWFDNHYNVLPFGHGVFSEAISAASLQRIWTGTVVPMLTDALGQVPEAFRPAFDAFPFRADSPAVPNSVA